MVHSTCVDADRSAVIGPFHKHTLGRCADMEWQTPAVSEKYQSRFGRRPGTSDSVDTGIGTSASDSTEGDDFCLFLLVLHVLCNMVLNIVICLTDGRPHMDFTEYLFSVKKILDISKLGNLYHF